MGLPVANPFAFDAQTRESSHHIDGLNLARQFPGDSNGSPTQRLAATLFGLATKLLGEEDLLVDFHSGGTRYEYLPMVGYHPTGDRTEQESRRLAGLFGINRLWEIPPSPNSTATFNGAIARSGIPAIGTEVRGRGGLVWSDVAPLVEGLRQVLVAKGMLEGDFPDAPVRAATVTHPVNCGASGIFRPLVELDGRVAAGSELAEIISATGSVEEVLVSPVEGRIWAIRRFASVRHGDQAFLIGMETG